MGKLKQDMLDREFVRQMLSHDEERPEEEEESFLQWAERQKDETGFDPE